MLNVALTGNAASGKSAVAALLTEWGATVIDADRLVHEAQRPDTPVFNAIVGRFGPGIVASDGTLDRAALRARVLADPTERRALEALVHPAVAAARSAAVEQARLAGAAVVVNDIPLLFEVLDPGAFDAVILVDAPETLRRDRLTRLRGLAPDEADRLMASQQPTARKRSRSTFIIENEGTLDDLRARTRAVWDALRQRAGIA
ncbi:MAG: dephospho-CoA kinase [Gemmatimonadales bacterium]